mgnify:CR=1 FL=1
MKKVVLITVLISLSTAFIACDTKYRHPRDQVKSSY